MLKLKDIDKENLFDVLKLKVKNEQENDIESNGDSIAEAKYFEYWVPCALYDNDNLIGFAMFGQIEIENNRVWLDRFMIDRKFQGKGYGKLFLVKILKYLKNKYECEVIFLSIYETNKKAIRLYEEIGFKFNGEIDRNNELVMCFKF